MTLAELSDMAQALGAVAVVASLVYLAIQTQQAARNARAAMHENRAATALRHTDQIVDPEFYPVWIKGNAAAADISDVEVERYRLVASAMIVTWEERFRQKQERMLDERRWAASERNIRLLTAAPGFRAVILGLRQGFDPDFGALMDKHVAQGRSAPVKDRTASWRDAAATELAAVPHRLAE